MQLCCARLLLALCGAVSTSNNIDCLLHTSDVWRLFSVLCVFVHASDLNKFALIMDIFKFEQQLSLSSAWGFSSFDMREALCAARMIRRCGVHDLHRGDVWFECRYCQTLSGGCFGWGGLLIVARPKAICYGRTFTVNGRAFTFRLLVDCVTFGADFGRLQPAKQQCGCHGLKRRHSDLFPPTRLECCHVLRARHCQLSRMGSGVL